LAHAAMPVPLIADSFASKLHGTEENRAAPEVTAKLDSPNVLGLSGLCWYKPLRSRAYL
jgi:hypothetical protein